MSEGRRRWERDRAKREGERKRRTRNEADLCFFLILPQTRLGFIILLIGSFSFPALSPISKPLSPPLFLSHPLVQLADLAPPLPPPPSPLPLLPLYSLPLLPTSPPYSSLTGIVRYFTVQSHLIHNRFPATRLPVMGISLLTGAVVVVVLGIVAGM